MTALSQPLMIRGRGITVAYRNADALKGVDFSANPGDLIAVVGANGAGKSTLLRTLAGLLPLQSGSIAIGEREIASVAPRELAKAVAFLPQDRAVHWQLNVRDVVALGRLPHRGFMTGESDADRAAIQSAMERMDVAQFSQRPIATLSGGERARALIARSLAQRAQILIADEPTAGLDPAYRLSIIAEFKRLADQGLTIIAALHDLSLAARFATRVTMLKQGRCIADGAAAQVLSKENLAEAFGIDAIIAEISGIPVIVTKAPLT